MKTLSTALDLVMNTATNAKEVVCDREPNICPICGKPIEKFYNTNNLKGWFPIACDCQMKAWEEEQRRMRMARKQQRINDLLDVSMKAPLYDDVRFEKTEIGKYESFDKAFNRCKKYCEIADKVLEANQGIYIYGEKGCGKTHITYCMMWELISKLYSCVMTSFNEIKRLEFCNRQDIIEDMINCDFLFIDDLGVEIVTKNDQDNWTQEEIYKILNARYNAKKPTIFSSNYSIAQLGTERGFKSMTLDRIHQMSTAIIKIEGVPSYRQQKVKKEQALF